MNSASGCVAVDARATGPGAARSVAGASGQWLCSPIVRSIPVAQHLLVGGDAPGGSRPCLIRVMITFTRMTTLAQSVHNLSTELTLVAPIDGVMLPLEDVPDPVFAQKMLGDGVAIDPTGSIAVAPCSGRVIQLHRARHAFTIRTPDNISVLVHVGLDTVNLKGEGFEALIEEGDQVSVGQPILRLDLDYISRHARSALTEVIVVEGGERFVFRKIQGLVDAGTDEIVRVSSEPAASTTRQATSVSLAGAEEVLSGPVAIVNPNGIHARPAARLADVAKQFQSAIFIKFGERSASAISPFDLMGLDLERGSKVRVSARGPDAAQAIIAVEAAIAGGLGESGADHTEQAAQRHVSADAGELGGVSASPGVAIGRVKVRAIEVPDYQKRASDPAAEREKLELAIVSARQGIQAEQAAFIKQGQEEKAQIFSAHIELLGEAQLVADAHASIAKGGSAAHGWQEAISSRVATLSALKSARLRERADDMKDIGYRVLFAVLGLEMPRLNLTKDTILVCEDLTPSTVAAFTPGSIGGIVTSAGGATSHAAIIARSMGVPYVAAVGEGLAGLTDGLLVVVDGSEGSVRLAPDEQQLARAKAKMEVELAAGLDAMKRAHEKCATLDGFHVEVAANIGSAKDAEAAVEKGCDGVGLLRSEFLFMKRREAPTEAEQGLEYEAIGKALGKERSLVIRTLDVGGDKPLAYLPQPEEENPFLGIRGLRLSLKHPEMFRVQIRAALKAALHTKLNLMFPMVAQYDEFMKARDMVREEMRATQVAASQVAIGVMVEVPSAALGARWLAREADFFSIGTNDLTQYTLAMDRGHSELTHQADAFDPAVLRLIQMTVEAAHAEKKWVGVCGGLAAEPLATALLVGLELDELSVPSPAIPELKDRVRSLRLSDCRAVAEGALAQPSAEKVRDLLKSYLTP